MKTKTIKRNTDAELLEGLCAELEISFEQKKQADEEIKALKAKVLEIINRDPQKYFQGERSFKVGAIMMKINVQHEYEFGEGFDLAKFMKKYPDAVKFELKHSQMTNINLEAHDLAHRPKESILIEHEKKK